MVGVRIAIDSDYTGLLEFDTFVNEGWVQQVFGAGQAVVDTRGQQFIQRLSPNPPKPARPIDWQTPKQLRAYYASHGFGRGIPSVRTGDINKWSLDTAVSANVFIVSLSNPSGHLRLVRGPLRRGEPDVTQRMFRNTWPPVLPVIESEAVDMAADFVEAIEDIARGSAS